MVCREIGIYVLVGDSFLIGRPVFDGRREIVHLILAHIVFEKFALYRKHHFVRVGFEITRLVPRRGHDAVADIIGGVRSAVVARRAFVGVPIARRDVAGDTEIENIPILPRIISHKGVNVALFVSRRIRRSDFDVGQVDGIRHSRIAAVTLGHSNNRRV